jgi:hypothetical protein
MGTLDAEYRTNETRYRAALVAEDTERREGRADLETAATGSGRRCWPASRFAKSRSSLTRAAALEGRTAEIVSELRAGGGFRGVPVPWQALETRAGETLAADVPDPMQTRGSSTGSSPPPSRPEWGRR